MAHTRESDPWAIIPNRSSGYMLSGEGEIVNRDAMQPSACLGAGTIVSTLGDMVKWDAAINHHRVLSRDSQDMMWKATTLTDGSNIDVGLGWFISPWHEHSSVSHAGGTAGFSCSYRRFTDSAISVMAFCNLYNIDVTNYAIMAADTIIPGLSYLSAPSISETDPDVRSRLLASMEEVASGVTSPAFISPKMMERYNEESREAWKIRLQEMLRFELVAHEKYEPKNAENGEIVSETYIYRLTMRKATLIITFMLTPDGKVGLQTRSDY